MDLMVRSTIQLFLPTIAKKVDHRTFYTPQFLSSAIVMRKPRILKFKVFVKFKFLKVDKRIGKK